jgi:hypothetical protein
MYFRHFLSHNALRGHFSSGILYAMGHDIFRVVGELTEITDPHPIDTNQKSACLFLSKHVLEVDDGENVYSIRVCVELASKNVFLKLIV